eukprot:CFRG1797T1
MSNSTPQSRFENGSSGPEVYRGVHGNITTGNRESNAAKSGSEVGRGRGGEGARGRGSGRGRGRGCGRGKENAGDGGRGRGRGRHNGTRGGNGGAGEGERRGSSRWNGGIPATQQSRKHPESMGITGSGCYYWEATSGRIRDDDDDSCPYYAWSRYFHIPWETCDFLTRIDQIIHFFTRHHDMITVESIYNEGKCSLDFVELVECQESDAPTTSEITETPDKILKIMGLAVHQIIVNYKKDPRISQISKIEVILFNHSPMTSLRQLTSSSIGRFISIKGTVVRVSNIKPRVSSMAFTCNSCGDSQAQYFTDGTYEVPQQCHTFECKGKIFTPERTSANTVTIDYQTIRIQEMVASSKKESGRIPRTIDCELAGCMLDTVVPGDIVHTSGEVKVVRVDDGGKKKNKSAMYLLYIQTNSITSSKSSFSKKTDTSSGYSMPDLYAIEEIQKHENLFRLLVHSIAPSIYGHDMIKAGLVLSLFASGQKFADDANRIPIRGGTHVLIVGDPGLGKSQMLQAVSDIAPRSVYVCGNTATAAGLTVSLVRDGSGSGDYALEAGALVLADQGCCCIDEFDKMGTDHQSLLEAMEQQSISIAKAGIVCTLPARTSIIAAANPIGGHYNSTRTVSENLHMSSALLSRFDLIFILLDKPNEEMDQLLSEHVLSLHSRDYDESSRRPREQEREIRSRFDDELEYPLEIRLKKNRGEEIDHIPAALLRKYVAYARQFVEPTLSAEACEILKEFYIGLRETHKSIDSTPITTRQLESLIRLSEARARSELREEVTRQDAWEAIEVMKHSLFEAAADEIGVEITSSAQMGNQSGGSKNAQRKRLVSHLNKVAHTTQNSLFTLQQLRCICGELKLPLNNFEEMVDALNNQGFLLKKGARVYQITTM